jgi:hypothetical protein
MLNHDHRRSLYFVHEEQRFDFLKEGRPHCRKKKEKKNKRRTSDQCTASEIRDQRSEIRDQRSEIREHTSNKIM